MTGKRFGYGAGVNWQKDVIIDYETEKSYDFYEVGKLLNVLNEENEQLRKEKECDKQVFTKKQLHELLQQTRKENEQLKERNEQIGRAHV